MIEESNNARSAGLSNRQLLDTVSTQQLWFHARKVRPIWATRVDTPQTVQTLEGIQEVPAGAYLCRGEAGEVWPQSGERLSTTYIATEEVTDGGWRKYEPRPDSEGVCAARIEHPFTVHSQWGRLQGKTGDYLVKNYRDNSDPDDVWIVDSRLFDATYERVEDTPA